MAGDLAPGFRADKLRLVSGPVTLERATAPDILQKVAEYKGREAVLVNFWAT